MHYPGYTMLTLMTFYNNDGLRHNMNM
uniref:Uncharacterized protein n=1 Tax=Anguilla anguilla TaxID=7936 RepID=A0A0E9RWJ4_ANGAN